MNHHPSEATMAPCSPAEGERGRHGFTLVEVMVAMVLASLLALGFAAMLTQLDHAFFQLTLRQKAVLLLQGEMERLVALYQKEYFYYREASFADGGNRFGRWLYREHPQGIKCPPDDSQCFLVTSQSDTTLTPADWGNGKVLFLNYDTGGNASNERNALWLDRSRMVTAQLFWELGDLSATTGNTCCQSLKVSLTFPYRFTAGVTPLDPVWGTPETITLQTIVCGKMSFPAPVARTGATAADSQRANDDGNLRRGMPWPSTRFSSQGNGTVLDNLTGLMWTQDTNCWGNLYWGNGSTLISNLSTLNTQGTGCPGYSASYSDWRISNSRELMSLVDAHQTGSEFLPSGHPFTNVTGPHQSSTWMYHLWVTGVYFTTGLKKSSSMALDNYPLFRGGGTEVSRPFWAVRNQTSDDLCAHVAPPPRTGNVKSSGTPAISIDDAYTKAGVPWPSPRFHDNGDGTVTDNLTGLMWTKDANLGNDCTGPNVASDSNGRDCFSSETLLSTMETVNDAFTSIATCNTSMVAGYQDWRVPNVKELEVMLDFGINTFPYDHPFTFPDNLGMRSANGSSYTHQCFEYFSSTSSSTSSTNKPSTGMFGVARAIYRGTPSYGYVWAVRGGP